MYIPAVDNCPHFFKTKFIDYNSLQYFSFNDIFHDDEDDESNMKLVNVLFNEKTEENINEEKKDKEEDFVFESIFKKSIVENNNNVIQKKSENLYFLCLSCGLILNTRELIIMLQSQLYI